MRKASSARRQAVLFRARHFAKRPFVPVRQEHRVIAEALRTARRPDQGTVDARFKFLDVSIRPGDAKRRNEMGTATLRRGRAAFAQSFFNLLNLCGAISSMLS